MPKPKFSKKRARDVEEDESGSDAPAAKAAPAKKAKASGDQLGSGKDGDGNPFWDISAKRRVGISTFKGAVLINLREFYEAADGKKLPTKKGISLSVEQYKELLKALPEINAKLKDSFGVKLGADADEVAEAAAGSVADSAPSKKVKAEAPKKANIEATSDEESD